MQEKNPSLLELDKSIDNFFKEVCEKPYTPEEMEEKVKKVTKKFNSIILKLQMDLIAANDKILELQNKKINK
jgi:hypothetical protein